MILIATNAVSAVHQRRHDAIEGALLGMAVGDAIGVPYEGMTARRAQRIFGAGGLRHRLLLGHGMVSDDTEHAAMTAQAMLASGGEVTDFRRSLAWRLRFWLLGAPAGIGLGTLRAILKLWVGFPPTRSGVHSAGNGPAMRAPIIGAAFADAPDTMRELARASTQITHRDERADDGALVIATAASLATRHGLELGASQALLEIRASVSNSELHNALEVVATLLNRLATPDELTAKLGTAGRVSGYMPHSVAAALFCWLRFFGDYRQSVESAVRLGGDTDTVAAIVGALAGATGGPSSIPQEWLSGIFEWPCSVTWLTTLADRLARRFPGNEAPEYLGPQPFFWPGQLLRNVLFAVVVLTHGFRRLLPPY